MSEYLKDDPEDWQHIGTSDLNLCPCKKSLEASEYRYEILKNKTKSLIAQYNELANKYNTLVIEHAKIIRMNSGTTTINPPINDFN